MHAMTIDALAGGGRVIIGLGVSGPQIVEGWYGQPWGSPNAAAPRVRGDHAQGARPRAADQRRPGVSRCPTAGPGATGQGKALRSILHPAGEHRDLARRRRPDEHRADAPSSPTAGCRWAGAPTARGLLRPALENGFAKRRRPPRRLRDLRRRRSVEITDDVQGRHRRHEAAHRDVRRRHGQRHAQLPPRGDGPARLPGGSRRASRSCGSPAARRRPSPPCPTSTSRRARCSAPEARIRERWDTVVAARGLTGPDRPQRPARRRSSWWPTSPAPATRSSDG